jgi:ribosomal protein S18 acetylase RimI-like enzyme
LFIVSTIYNRMSNYPGPPPETLEAPPPFNHDRNDDPPPFPPSPPSTASSVPEASDSEEFYFHLRLATLADVPTLASLDSAACLDTGITRFLHPHRLRFLEDFTCGFQQRIRSRFSDPRTITIVAVTDTDDLLIVGYAQFLRAGSDAGAASLLAQQDTWKRRVQRGYVGAVNKWHGLTFRDRSANPGAIAMYENWKAARPHWSEETYRNRWHVQAVAVSPEHQRKGVAKALMGPVIGRAMEEGVPVGVETSRTGIALFRSLGFRMKAEFEGKLEGCEGGGAMVLEPFPRRASDGLLVFVP